MSSLSSNTRETSRPFVWVWGFSAAKIPSVSNGKRKRQFERMSLVSPGEVGLESGIGPWCTGPGEA